MNKDFRSVKKMCHQSNENVQLKRTHTHTKHATANKLQRILRMHYIDLDQSNPHSIQHFEICYVNAENCVYVMGYCDADMSLCRFVRSSPRRIVRMQSNQNELNCCVRFFPAMAYNDYCSIV